MCGFAGLYLPRSAADRRIDLGAMLGVMRHRGPDGCRTHVSADGRFQAGFARLAIIDAATGDQPLVEDGGAVAFLGNGEIYNYIELRQELEADGVAFRTHGDMEPALKLYRRQGDAFVDALNGMFALAVHDQAADRLLLARDRLGIKPLYWTLLPGGGLLFASEIKALFASGLVTPAIDPAAVAAYLAHGWVPAPATLYRGINKLPPGCRLSMDGSGEIRLERYWAPAAAADLPADAGAARAALTALMRDAVRLQLRADVPMAALLSGGIDSGMVVALAASQSATPINTFTVRFAGAAVDESPLAALVAERYGTRHTCFDLDTGALADALPRLVWHTEEPLYDASLLPNFLINEVLSRQTRVVLNGTGGDELFGGYGRYFRQPVEARYLRLPGWLRHGVVEPAVGTLSPMTAWRLGRAEHFDGNRGRYLFEHSTHFPPPLRRLIGCPLPVGKSAQEAAFAGWRGDSTAGALAADMATYLPEDLLLLLDRSTMAASVEGRVPLLDHRLVEAALALPAEQRTPGGRQKGLLRAIAADWLPAPLLTAPKHGFVSPVAAWFRSDPLAKAVVRILTSRQCLERGWWTAEGIHRLAADRATHAYRLYSLLMLEMTVRVHVDGGADARSASLFDYAGAS